MSGRTSQEYTLKQNTAANTVSATGALILAVDRFDSAIFILDVTVASGTTPTLNVFIQHGVTNAGPTEPDGGTPTGSIVWDDFVAFTQATAVSRFLAKVEKGGNFTGAASDAALTAGTVRNGPVGKFIRVKWTIGGTTPSFNFTVTGSFMAS